jgi:hypothetical protein
MAAKAARILEKLRERLGGEEKLQAFLNQPDARKVRDTIISSLDESDHIFVKERDNLRKKLEKAYKLKKRAVESFFRRFPIQGQHNFQEVLAAIEALPREIQRAMKEHLTFASRFGVRFVLHNGQFSLRPQVTYGRKFLVKQVKGHLKAARAVPHGEPALDYWEAPDLQVWARTQELIDKGKVKFVQVEDERGGYSVLNELERVAYQRDGITVILHKAERPYLYFMLGEAVRKTSSASRKEPLVVAALDELGSTLTAFQQEYFEGRAKPGRPPDLKRQKTIDNKLATAEPGTSKKDIAGDLMGEFSVISFAAQEKQKLKTYRSTQINTIPLM